MGGFATLIFTAVGTRTECIVAQVRREREEEEAVNSDQSEHFQQQSMDSGGQFCTCMPVCVIDIGVKL